MSQHSSLRVSGVGAGHRNVLKRFERIQQLAKEGKWDESKSVYNLPKVKSLKIKVKKVKTEKEEKPAAGAPAEKTAAPAPAQKTAPVGAATAKGAAKPAAPKGK
ncbi:MAG: small basic protein [Candidatus Omnitrophica bacterium]|nr:small basic protein [Candidatus Omnitrophota bacterium]